MLLQAVKEAYNSLPGRTRGNLTRMTSCQILDSHVMSAVISKEVSVIVGSEAGRMVNYRGNR